MNFIEYDTGLVEKIHEIKFKSHVCVASLAGIRPHSVPHLYLESAHILCRISSWNPLT